MQHRPQQSLSSGGIFQCKTKTASSRATKFATPRWRPRREPNIRRSSVSPYHLTKRIQSPWQSWGSMWCIRYKYWVILDWVTECWAIRRSLWGHTKTVRICINFFTSYLLVTDNMLKCLRKNILLLLSALFKLILLSTSCYQRWPKMFLFYKIEKISSYFL